MEITKEQLDDILKKHALWINNESGGERAGLRGADLRGANLYQADRSRADRSRADLGRADLSRADLGRANLHEADLHEADLYQADLRGANLSGANLSGANLSGANLSGANLSGANLSGANLYQAGLRGADLSGADLSGANLSGANLGRAYLGRAKNLNFPMACPEEGSFIGFKKCQDGKIVKLKIPVDALRCSATGRKCRCSKAKVLSITNIDGTDANVGMAISKYDRNFIYKVGETIEVPNFNTDRWNECSTGIHFFITRQEAVDYIY